MAESAVENERKKPVAPTMQGELWKLKKTPSVLGSWNKRYFKVNVDTDSLEYYKSEESSKPVKQENGEIKEQPPQKVFPLRDLMAVQGVNELSFQVLVKGKSEQSIIFLRADDAVARRKWVNSLDTYLNELQAYDKWLTMKGPVSKPTILAIKGTLKKLKQSHSSFGSWNKRHFQTNPGNETLEYFSADPTQETALMPSKVISLNDIVAIRGVDSWTFQLVVKNNTANTNSGNDQTAVQDFFYVLRSNYPEDKQRWQSVLENYVAEKQAYVEYLALSSGGPMDTPAVVAESPVLAALVQDIPVVPVVSVNPQVLDKEQDQSSSSSAVLMEGWLRKKSNAAIVGWQERYCTISTTGTFTYYANKIDATGEPKVEKGKFDLRDIEADKRSGLLKGRYLSLHVKDRVYEFEVEDESVAATWVTAIQHVHGV